MLFSVLGITPGQSLTQTSLESQMWHRAPVAAMVAPDDADDEYLSQLEQTLQRASSGDRVRADPQAVRIRDSRRPALDLARESASSKPIPQFFHELRELQEELDTAFSEYADRPSQQFVLGSLSLLLGFFVSHGQAIGGGDQGGRWEYLSAMAATFVVERITIDYHRRSNRQRSPTLKLLNAFKVGFVYGCVLDAIKFAG
jgi:hypothetical protein